MSRQWQIESHKKIKRAPETAEPALNTILPHEEPCRLDEATVPGSGGRSATLSNTVRTVAVEITAGTGITSCTLNQFNEPRRTELYCIFSAVSCCPQNQ